jgi:folate-dependent phosphoribosylglycinamide formyltransferase PurN
MSPVVVDSPGRQPASGASTSYESAPIGRSTKGFRYFGPQNFTLSSVSSVKPQEPLKICVVTSVRDIGGDDCAGSTVEIEGRRTFVKGSLHSLLDACGRELAGYAQVQRIIVDDIPGYRLDHEKMTRAGRKYSCTPDGSGLWIVPPEYKTPQGTPIQQLVEHVPSYFRALARDDQRRSASKLAWEAQIANVARESGSTIILSDHCMALFGALHREHFPGRVVNIHPAITWGRDPRNLRGASPTKEAIDRAGAPAPHSYGFTGSSFHFIADQADDGPVICDAERTPVDPGMSPEALRLRNYEYSKVPVLIAGLRYLACNFEALTRPVVEGTRNAPSTAEAASA